jgi:hypothetical protein
MRGRPPRDTRALRGNVVAFAHHGAAWTWAGGPQRRRADREQDGLVDGPAPAASSVCSCTRAQRK